MSAVMVQGTASDAGKSLIVTGLCRWLHRQGVRCAPFKAQNMSNNARVVDGGEIGVAQWLQALAAGALPDVRMNPVLLKPENDTRSQVVLNGDVSPHLSETPWRGRGDVLWPHVARAFDSLSGEFDVVVVEGAGSPAETNLWSDDVANMRLADHADARVVLVADIDRGGAFAHLYGTWALLKAEWRGRVDGFILNKFRGDRALLEPGPHDLHERCGVPTLGVVPKLDHTLPAEEGPTVIGGARTGPRVLIVCGPYASNLDEFVRLQEVTQVSWVREGRSLAGADLVVLPGSKHVANDLAWMRTTGLDEAVREAAAAGTPILGICGGLQILGGPVSDPHGVEAPTSGLRLLPVATEYQRVKRVAPVTVSVEAMPPPWGWMSNRTLGGYEIRFGETRPEPGATSVMDGLGHVSGSVLGVCFHGLFEDPELLQAFTGTTPPPLAETFELLADAIEDHFESWWLEALLERNAA